MSDEWRKPLSELNFRDGCFRGSCFRQPCFRDPCEPPEGEGDGEGEGDFFFIEFDGDSSYIDGADDASLDNLPNNPFTVDVWVRSRNQSAIVSKYWWPTIVGWELGTIPGGVEFYMVFSVQDAYCDTNEALPNNTWTHLVGTFDRNGDGKPYIAIGGTWCTYLNQQSYMGVVDDDSARSLGFGASNTWGDLDISWVRISSGIRYPIGVNFTPPDRCPPPAVDGTTIELWAMDEGAGAVTAASVNSPANDGAMTDCVWHVCT